MLALDVYKNFLKGRRRSQAVAGGGLPHYVLPSTGNTLSAKPLCHFLYVPTLQHVARCLGITMGYGEKS